MSVKIDQMATWGLPVATLQGPARHISIYLKAIRVCTDGLVFLNLKDQFNDKNQFIDKKKTF